MLGRPYNNSIGREDRLRQRSAMVRFSRDLLERWGGQYAYGDTLTLWTLQGVEKWVVQDCMAPRFTQKIDFLQPVGKRKNGRFALILE
jgi:hypothetical protein